MTRGQLKVSIRENLTDNGVKFYSEDELNESLQDAYNDIVALTQCIVKTTTLNWQVDLSYYDFKLLGVSDYLTTIGIFNNVTNLWLSDDLTLRDFDKIRRNWETQTGTPIAWTPSDPKHIAICAKYTGAASDGAFNGYAFTPAFYIEINLIGTFNLLYAATAPIFVSDNDVPLVATDMQDLFEDYVTADLLEQAEEYSKAADSFQNYYSKMQLYKTRVKKLNKSDLLLRV